MKRWYLLAAAVTMSGTCFAQTWRNAYETGLQEAKAGNWPEARELFKQASKARHGDSTRTSYLGDGLFEHRKWRDGAPYSPDFLAAYSGLKLAFELPDSRRAQLLHDVASEFETLLNKREYCQELFFFLDETYVLLSESDKRIALGRQYQEVGYKASWKMDAEAISADDEEMLSQLPPPPAPEKAAPREDRKAITREVSKPHERRSRKHRSDETTAPLPAVGAETQVTPPAPVTEPAAPQPKAQVENRSGKGNEPKIKLASDITPAESDQSHFAPMQPKDPVVISKGVRHGQNPPVQTVIANITPIMPVNPKPEVAKPVAKAAASSLISAVPVREDKYAIIIGNGVSKIDGGALPFASDDAQLVRKTLITCCGYSDSNIEVIIDGTAAQIAASMNALASRIPDKATVLIYFTGVGENVDGKDFLAGVDTDMNGDASTMISKDDIYQAFMQRGARVFAFFQTNRPIQDGHYFGSEIPLVGSVSQMQATLPGENVYSVTSDGKQVGLFTNSLVAVLNENKSNQTPILDFGWQVFYKLRTAGTGSSGGSSNQSPSLPVLTNMASDARF